MDIISWFFGVMGFLLMLLFLGTVWYWMKYNTVEKGETKKAGNWKILGYLFLIIGFWFLCGVLGPQGSALRPERSNLEVAIALSYIVITLLFLGFLCIFIGQRKLYKAKSISQ